MFCLYVFVVFYPTLGAADPFFERWLAINYYHHNITGGYTSEITNADYFVSPQGRTNPQAELDAFKNLITAYLKDGSNKETLCKFPARLTLIGLPESNRPICQEYIESNQPESIQSISLFFASGYFDNPSSYYGHMLLKFNYPDEVNNQTSLDSSLNYGATATNNEGSLLYILKGLFGGYDATYQRNNHFLFSNNYTNRQIRDIWEYQLNLTPEQKRFIVEHSWELKNAKFTYYFFSNNCANRIAKIVELATGRDLSKTSGFWAMPMAIVRKAAKTPMIEEEIYNPSLKKIFSDKYNQLTAEEKKQFIAFFDVPDAEKENLVKKLDGNNLVLALEYLDLLVAKKTIKSKDKAELKRQMDILEKQRGIVLSQLMHLPPAPVKPEEPKDPAYTLLTSQPASVLRIGYQNNKEGESVKIGYRAANNDFLNPRNPGQEVSKFTMGEIETEIKNDSLHLHKLVAVDILNLNTNPLPMRMTNEYSWGMKIDYAAPNNICSKCSNAGIEGKLGTAARINKDLMFYGLAGGRLHTIASSNQDFITGVSELGSVINTSEHTILVLTANYNIDAISGHPEYLLKANFGINLSKDIDCRMSLENNAKGSAFLASFGYYFD